jgi:hypothetical protein
VPSSKASILRRFSASSPRARASSASATYASRASVSSGRRGHLDRQRHALLGDGVDRLACAPRAEGPRGRRGGASPWRRRAPPPRSRGRAARADRTPEAPRTAHEPQREGPSPQHARRGAPRREGEGERGALGFSLFTCVQSPDTCGSFDSRCDGCDVLTGLSVSAFPCWPSAAPGRSPSRRPLAPRWLKKRKRRRSSGAPSKSGLGFRLSQVDGDGPQKRAKEAVTTPLDDKETQALLARVAPIKDAPEGRRPVRAPGQVAPSPPSPGETRQRAVPLRPPGPPPAEVVAGPLKVERALPKGDVPIAPHLAVTFSHPMVPLTSHAELSNLPSPREAHADPEGRVALARYPDRDVPAGPQVPDGHGVHRGHPGRDPRDERQSARKRLNISPSRRRPLACSRCCPTALRNTEDPLLYVELDQEVDPAKVLPHVRLSGGGLSSIPLRLATEAEIEKDKSIAYRPREGREGARLRVQGRPSAPARLELLPERPKRARPPPKVPSPRRRITSSRSARTARCSSASRRAPKKEPCEPADSFYPLVHETAFRPRRSRPAQVEIVPPLPHAKITTSGSGISIQGHKKGRTVYRVTVKAGAP